MQKYIPLHSPSGISRQMDPDEHALHFSMQYYELVVFYVRFYVSATVILLF